MSRGKCVQTFIGHSSSVIVVEIFSKEKLISGSADGFIKIWDLLGNWHKHEKLLKSCDELKHILLNGKDIVTEMRFNLINSIQLIKEKAIIEIEDQLPI